MSYKAFQPLTGCPGKGFVSDMRDVWDAEAEEEAEEEEEEER